MENTNDELKHNPATDGKPLVSGSCFGIRAECRTSKKRVIIKRNMTKETAEAWLPDGFTKKMYRYFRVVDVNNYR